MSLPIVESLGGLQESIFSPFRGPQFNSREKSKKCSNFIKLPQFPLLAHVGPMAVWGVLLGSCPAKASVSLVMPRAEAAFGIDHSSTTAEPI